MSQFLLSQTIFPMQFFLFGRHKTFLQFIWGKHGVTKSNCFQMNKCRVFGNHVEMNRLKCIENGFNLQCITFYTKSNLRLYDLKHSISKRDSIVVVCFGCKGLFQLIFVYNSNFLSETLLMFLCRVNAFSPIQNNCYTQSANL